MNMVVTLNGRHQVKLIGRMTGVRKQVMITAMAINRTKSKPNQFQTQFTIPTVAWKTERIAHRLNPTFSISIVR